MDFEALSYTESARVYHEIHKWFSRPGNWIFHEISGNKPDCVKEMKTFYLKQLKGDYMKTFKSTKKYKMICMLYDEDKEFKFELCLENLDIKYKKKCVTLEFHKMSDRHFSMDLFETNSDYFYALYKIKHEDYEKYKSNTQN